MQISPSFEVFEEKFKHQNAQLVWARLSADMETPVSAATKLDNEKFLALFESVEGGETRARFSFIVVEPELIWRSRDGKAEINHSPTSSNDFKPCQKEVFESLRSLMDETKIDIPSELPAMAYGLFGYMSYDMVRHMEVLPHHNEDNINIADSVYVRPRIVIVFDAAKDEMLVISAIRKREDLNAESAWLEAKARLKEVLIKLDKPLKKRSYLLPEMDEEQLEPRPNMEKSRFFDMVRKAKEYILAGDIFQVVLSQRFTLDFKHSPMALYRALRRLNPSPFSFYMNIDGAALVGSSPEILVRLKDGKVTVRPIAGTRKRGKDADEDKALEADLLADSKETAEHLMLLDLGRNDVGRVAALGSVKVTSQMHIEHYSHVMHIVSNVEGQIADGKDALDALIAGFPAGTVSGAPKIRAMEIIEELEPERRSFYAGCVGYFSASGDMDSCISLRTGLVKDKKLYIQAGGGIVVDSTEEGEYQESCNKAGALLQAAKQAVKFEERE